jgi:hypothetical protein
LCLRVIGLRNWLGDEQEKKENVMEELAQRNSNSNSSDERWTTNHINIVVHIYIPNMIRW